MTLGARCFVVSPADVGSDMPVAECVVEDFLVESPPNTVWTFEAGVKELLASDLAFCVADGAQAAIPVIGQLF